MKMGLKKLSKYFESPREISNFDKILGATYVKSIEGLSKPR